MIEFASLFLGLVFGVQTIELRADAAVTKVELRLDGEILAVDEEAPWSFEIDLGPDLLPHRLEAVGFDAAGLATGSAEQWLNLPKDRAEVRVLVALEPSPSAEVVWRAVDFDRPEHVRVELDGQVLATPQPAGGSLRVGLPPLELEAFHLLSAEVVFSPEVRTRTDVVFGGLYGDVTDTELTSFVVRGRERPPHKMEDWFEVDGQILRPVAMEKGPAEIVVVRERSAALYAALPNLYEGLSLPGVPPAPRVLGVGDRLRFVVPQSRTESEDEAAAHIASDVTAKASAEEIPEGDAPGPQDTDLEPASETEAPEPSSELLPESGGSFRALSFIHAAARQRMPDETPVVGQHVSDSVAIAGLWAAGSGRRRAVVLILGGDTADTSALRPAGVRAYLEALGVPLVVWSVAPIEESPWGAVRTLESPSGLVSALRDLAKELAQQHVVWLEGDQPAHRIALTDEAKRLEKAN